MRQSHELYVSILLMIDLHTNTNTKNLVPKIKQQQLCPWIPLQDNFARQRHTFVTIEEGKRRVRWVFHTNNSCDEDFPAIILGEDISSCKRLWNDKSNVSDNMINAAYLARQTFSHAKCFENGKLNFPTNVIIAAFVQRNLHRSKVPWFYKLTDSLSLFLTSFSPKPPIFPCFFLPKPVISQFVRWPIPMVVWVRGVRGKDMEKRV